jgi:hypothetical protein
MTDYADGLPVDTRAVLKDMIARRLDLRWSEFAEHHPQLAAAIERTQLVDLAVSDLSRDPDLRQALDAAAVDEATLRLAGQLFEAIDRWVGRAIPR